MSIRFIAALRDDRGVTLPELIIVLMLMGLVITSAYFVLLSTTLMSDTIDARGIASNEMRLGVDRMTRELRQAQEVNEGNGAFATATAQRVSFYVDLQHDNVPELVTYYVSGDRLYRAVSSATIQVYPYDFGPEQSRTTLIQHLKPGWTPNVFAYYDNANPPAQVADVSEVSAVKIRVYNSATAGQKTSSIDNTTWVKVRAVHNSIN